MHASALYDQPRETFETFGEFLTIWTSVPLDRISKRDWKSLHFGLSNANGHITLNTPVLVRSLKLSNVESSQYLDGWPPGNTGCCWLNSTFWPAFSFDGICLVFSQDFVSCFHKIFQPFLWQNSGNLEEWTRKEERNLEKKSRRKKEGSQQHPVFPGGHPSKYWLDSTLLNFSDRTRTGVFNVIWPLAFESDKFRVFQSLFPWCSSRPKTERKLSFEASFQIPAPLSVVMWEVEKVWICHFQMPTAISHWIHQFSSDHWS